METSPRTDGVKSAHRALSILELLTREERPLSFAEIGELLGYPRSSLHGLLRTMSDRGWLEQHLATRNFTLGIRAWEAGNTYLRAVDLRDRAMPFMERVRDQLDETVQLAILDGRHNVYVAKAEGTQRLALASVVGRSLEAHATGLGKVLLAGLEPEELDRRLPEHELERHTARTITDPVRLREELRRVRERGYATDDGEYVVGVRCVAVPVYDQAGALAAAMSISIPTVRYTATKRQLGLRLLREAAGDLSSSLGYRPQRGSRRLPELRPASRSRALRTRRASIRW
jgi:DNA-binding IclR family transcriptional regulator